RRSFLSHRPFRDDSLIDERDCGAFRARAPGPGTPSFQRPAHEGGRLSAWNRQVEGFANPLDGAPSSPSTAHRSHVPTTFTRLQRFTLIRFSCRPQPTPFQTEFAGHYFSFEP